MSGLLSLLSDPDDPKVMGMAVSDYVTGLSAGYGILGALLARQQSGAGCRVETSLLQATLSFIGETAAGYLRTGNVPNPHGAGEKCPCFCLRLQRRPAAGDSLLGAGKILVGTVEGGGPHGYRQRTSVSRARDARRQNYEALEQALAPTFKNKTRDEWLKIFAADDVPAVPLYNVAEVLDDPQVKHLGLTETVEHPQAGTWQFVGGPVRYDNLTKEKSPRRLWWANTAVRFCASWLRRTIASTSSSPRA